MNSQLMLIPVLILNVLFLAPSDSLGQEDPPSAIKSGIDLVNFMYPTGALPHEYGFTITYSSLSPHKQLAEWSSYGATEWSFTRLVRYNLDHRDRYVRGDNFLYSEDIIHERYVLTCFEFGLLRELRRSFSSVESLSFILGLSIGVGQQPRIRSIVDIVVLDTIPRPSQWSPDAGESDYNFLFCIPLTIHFGAKYLSSGFLIEFRGRISTARATSYPNMMILVGHEL